MSDQDRAVEAGHPPSRTVTKPLLVAVSHAIEEFALAGPADEPVAVVALFQRHAYFLREADRYARIARGAGPTLVGLAGDLPPQSPSGVAHVRLDPDEPLAREWSVTVLGPRAGATLVAHDLEEVDGTARSLERGRRFAARWSFRRAAAHAELTRLRTALGSRVPVTTDAALDGILRTAPGAGPDHGGGPAPDGPEHREGRARDADARHDAATALLLDRLSAQAARSDRAEGRLDDLDPGAERDPHTGLPTRAFLDRWTARSAPGTLPVGLVLLRVQGLGAGPRHGLRAEPAVLQSIARILRRQTGGADRAVRVGREEFLLVLPSRDADQLARAAAGAQAEISALSAAYPYVPTPATAVITTTRDRPLPLGPLWAALDRAVEAAIPVTELGGY